MANKMTMKRLRTPKDGATIKGGEFIGGLSVKKKNGGSTKAKSGKADREKPRRSPAKKGNRQPTGSSHRY